MSASSARDSWRFGQFSDLHPRDGKPCNDGKYQESNDGADHEVEDTKDENGVDLYTATMQEIEINFRRLSPLATLPVYQSELAAGMDLHAAIEVTVTIEPGAIAMIPCGFALEIPPGYEGQVRPRSGLACKHGVSIPNSPGTVDADYRGEMKVALINLGRTAFTVEPSMRIAQLVIAPVLRAHLRETTQLSDTARGSGGFGSTGVGSKGS